VGDVNSRGGEGISRIFNESHATDEWVVAPRSRATTKAFTARPLALRWVSAHLGTLGFGPSLARGGQVPALAIGRADRGNVRTGEKPWEGGKNRLRGKMKG
jgi:hypothetical protein